MSFSRTTTTTGKGKTRRQHQRDDKEIIIMADVEVLD
jgi:hypothetical protein